MQKSSLPITTLLCFGNGSRFQKWADLFSREFLYVDDLAKLLIQPSKVDRSRIAHALPTDFSHINVGSQSEISIRDLALVVGEAVGFKGAISFDTSKPDGAARKLLCSQHSRVYTNVNYTSLRLV